MGNTCSPEGDQNEMRHILKAIGDPTITEVFQRPTAML